MARMVYFRNQQYENTADLYAAVQKAWVTISAYYVIKLYEIIPKRLLHVM